jgi:hypothetical protein
MLFINKVSAYKKKEKRFKFFESYMFGNFDSQKIKVLYCYNNFQSLFEYSNKVSYYSHGRNNMSNLVNDINSCFDFEKEYRVSPKVRKTTYFFSKF